MNLLQKVFKKPDFSDGYHIHAYAVEKYTSLTICLVVVVDVLVNVVVIGFIGLRLRR
ncbi:MAG TPA: hypothetical protein VGL91_06710 [Acidobacteriota bacterium]